MTENETLRARNAALMREIRDRDMAEFRARQETIDREHREAEERDRLAREETTAKELEERRRAAWLTHRVDAARALGNDAFVQLLSKNDMLEGIPDEAWPPGYEPPDHLGVRHQSPDSAANTLVGQLLAKKGIEI
jgi:hypothetical protein